MPATASAVRTFASPKSSSFTPVFPSMMLAGLQVAVNQAVAMRIVECISNLDGALQRLLQDRNHTLESRALLDGPVSIVFMSNS